MTISSKWIVLLALTVVLIVFMMLSRQPVRSTSSQTSDQSQPGPAPALIPENQSNFSSSAPAEEPSNTAASGQSAASANVTVNGQSIPIPANGSTDQTIENSDGSQTTVNVQHQSSSTNQNGAATSTTKLQVNVHSSNSSVEESL